MLAYISLRQQHNMLHMLAGFDVHIVLQEICIFTMQIFWIVDDRVE